MTDIKQKALEAKQKQFNILMEKVTRNEVLSPSELKTLDALEKELDESQVEEVYMTIEEVLAYTGYKQRTIYSEVSKEALRRQSDKTFAQSDVDAWLKSKGKSPKNHTGDESEDFQEARHVIKYKRFRAIKEQLIVDKMNYELIPRELVEQQFLARVGEFKTALTLLSHRLAHQVAAKSGIEFSTAAEIIDTEVTNILAGMSRKIDINVDSKRFP